MRCSTNIRKQVSNIAEWFSIANPTSELLLDLNTIIQTSVQITNRIYPYQQIEPDITIDDNVRVTSSLNLIYIVRILLDNIIQHSNLGPSDLNIKIEAKSTSDDYLMLKFVNNINSNVNITRLTETLEATKIKWQQSQQDFTKIDVEGGSGFDKIRRILTFDMLNKSHYFDYEIRETEIVICIFLKVRYENE